MREVITDVNRSQDEKNDLIVTKDIKIGNYLMRNSHIGPEDYTGFVMEVINAAINVTREPFANGHDMTVYEKFYEFSEMLFHTSQKS